MKSWYNKLKLVFQDSNLCFSGYIRYWDMTNFEKKRSEKFQKLFLCQKSLFLMIISQKSKKFWILKIFEIFSKLWTAVTPDPCGPRKRNQCQQIRFFALYHHAKFEKNSFTASTRYWPKTVSRKPVIGFAWNFYQKNNIKKE